MEWKGDLLAAADLDTRIVAYRVLAVVYVLFGAAGVASRVRYEGAPAWLAAALGLVVGGSILVALWTLGGDEHPLSPVG